MSHCEVWGSHRQSWWPMEVFPQAKQQTLFGCCFGSIINTQQTIAVFWQVIQGLSKAHIHFPPSLESPVFLGEPRPNISAFYKTKKNQPQLICSTVHMPKRRAIPSGNLT